MIGQDLTTYELKNELKNPDNNEIALIGENHSGRKTLVKKVAKECNLNIIWIGKKIEEVLNFSENIKDIYSRNIVVFYEYEFMQERAKLIIERLIENNTGNITYIYILREVDANDLLGSKLFKNTFRKIKMQEYTYEELIKFSKGCYKKGNIETWDKTIFKAINTPSRLMMVDFDKIEELNKFVKLVCSKFNNTNKANLFRILDRLDVKNKEGFDTWSFFRLYIQRNEGDFYNDCVDKKAYSQNKLNKTMRRIRETQRVLIELESPNVNKSKLLDDWLLRIINI